MTADPLALQSHADLEQYAAELKRAGGRIQPVVWAGAPAWLKLSEPQPPAWRYQLLAGMARLVRQPALQPVRPSGGAEGLRNEARRIEALSAAGVHVPALLAQGEEWLLIGDLGRTTLESRIRGAESGERLTRWRLGADYLSRVHRADQYLSQAFARNLVWSPETGLGAIDFEDDPATTMSLPHAQIRDWLPYLFSTAIYFETQLPALAAELRSVLARESSTVRDGVGVALRRTAWVRALKHLPRRMQRRDVIKTRCFGELARCYGRLER